MIDGDSLGAAVNGRIQELRLYGIDAPEHGQPGADEARNALVRMLGREHFIIELQHEDPYGRGVVLIYHQGQHRRNSVNLRLVREGYAYAWTRYGGSELGFHQAEADARQGRRGIWRDDPRGGERPWEFRRRNRRGGSGGMDRAGWLAAAAGAVLLAIIIGAAMAAG